MRSRVRLLMIMAALLGPSVAHSVATGGAEVVAAAAATAAPASATASTVGTTATAAAAAAAAVDTVPVSAASASSAPVAPAAPALASSAMVAGAGAAASSSGGASQLAAAGGGGGGGGNRTLLFMSGYSQMLHAYTWASTREPAKEIAASDSVKGSASFMAFNDEGTLAYCVNEFETSGNISAFALDGATGKLKHLSTVSSYGHAPAHLMVYQPHSSRARFVYAANYFTGTLVAYRIQPDGSIAEPPLQHLHAGNNTHMVFVPPGGRHMLVPCLGSDYVAQYHLDPVTGLLTPNTPPTFPMRAGAGPRQLALHPNGKWLYVLCELGSMLASVYYDPARGVLSAPEYISTLPADTPDPKAYGAAAVRVSHDGNFVYASNRGPSSSIATFRINPSNGRLTSLGFTTAGGDINWPRDMTLSPVGAPPALLVANQKGNSVTVFDIAPSTGQLTRVRTDAVFEAPTFTAFVPTMT